MQRRMIIPVMVMLIGHTMPIVRTDPDEIDGAVTHAAFGTDTIGKRPHGAGRAVQHDRLQQ